MAHTIYPTDLQAPVTLAIGAAMPAFVQLAGHIGPDPANPGLEMMFIRISMSGAAPATHPKIELRAVHPMTATEGAPVTIDPALDTALPGKALSDGTNPTDAANAFFTPPYLNNVYLLKVAIFNPGTLIKIKITNETGAQRDFVWVVADSDANSQQPWIHISPATLNYNVLINQSASLTTQTVSIANRGTGPLTVTNTTPALPPASFTSSGLPVTVAPNAVAASVPITFVAPATVGTLAAATFAFDGDSSSTFGPGHNRNVALSAKTQSLELALLLDDSGSMTWDPDADPIPPAPGPSRWDALRNAANQFLDLLAVFGSDKGTFGVARFPTEDPLTPVNFDVVQPIPIPSVMGTHQIAIGNVAPFFGGTPIGDGLNRVLTPGANYFSTDAVTIPLKRRWILLMTDGAHHEGTHHPLEFVTPSFGGTATQAASLAGKQIKVFSVGYGVEGKAEVNFELLANLSNGSFEGGAMVEVESSGLSAPALAKAFRTAITTGLVTVSSPTDPSGTLRRGNPEARHKVIITPYDTKIAFILNWNTEDARRMHLHLLTPTCDLITPESAGNNFGAGEIGFSGASRYQIYRIDESYLRNDDNPASPRYGTWTMVVFSDELRSRGDSEYYEYDVIVESRLQMEVRLDRPTYYAGDTIGITAILTLDGKPITQANLNVKVTKPGQAVNNWLAAIKISGDEFQRAQVEVNKLTQQDSNPLFVKAFAAERRGLVFDKFTTTVTIPMNDPDNDGVYTAAFSQTTTPGSYKLYVTAVGATEEGVVFRRERALEVRLGVRPHPDYTLIDIRYGALVSTTRLITATVHVTPRDKFGNVVLLDPTTSKDIVLRATGGTLDENLTTEFDGTYSTRLSYQAGAKPALSLSVAGEAVVSNQVVAAVDQLRYVDQVHAFKPGLEGALGANLHADPLNALGDIRQKQPDAFVSLGAYGSLTVGVNGHVILAQGDADITVFVQPDSNQRSYLVEATPVGKPETWVEIGKSAGTTQSFSLKKVHLDGVLAVRITDTSGRTRGDDMKPIKSPGVSFRGIGVAKVRPASKLDYLPESLPKEGCLGALIKFLKSLWRK